MFKATIFTAVLLVSAPVLAQSQPVQSQQQKPTTAKPKPNNQRVICHVQQDIGSRLATTRVCMTAAQWSQQQQEARDEVDRGQRQGPQ